MGSVKEPDLVRNQSNNCGWGRRPEQGIWRRVCAGLFLVAACSCIAQNGHPATPGAGGTAAPSGASTAQISPLANAKQGKPQAAVAAEEQRKKQITAEGTQLLAMAEALKAEVDETNKDVLSLNVIRKADEIERLAHNVKEKIKQTSGPN